uniref:non-specific serine/threonine protein kinase n=1 Tax=Kalanchoe fedtschenkoi TaxID=63787 RepID=A0A7N0T5Q6_KALFE
MKWGGRFCARTLVWIRAAAFVLCLLGCCGSVEADGGADRDVLLEIKRLVSDPAGILASWDAGSGLSHCGWYGVSCDSKSRVSEIRLVGGGGGDYDYGSEAGSCSGVFPFHGCEIRRNFSVGVGKLGGRLSSRVGELDQLRVLSLGYNRFNGQVPVGVWGMENLEVLDLEGNMFTGEIPARFSGLRKLRVLNLRFNGLSGQVKEVANFRFLRVLDLAGNGIDGVVPEFVDRYGNGCEYLEHLDLSGNAIDGPIPRSLGKCRRLRSVLLFSNNFTGTIPKEFGRLRKLEVLDVSRNSLGGFIPAELGNCASLSVLVLSNSVDPLFSWRSAGGQAKLSAYADERNIFQGLIPSEVAELAKVKMIWAPRAKLQGKLPQNWGSGLQVLNLADNQLVGEITGLFPRCHNLHHLNLSSNKLVGKLDEKLHVPCMTVFDISANLMSGAIPLFRNDNCTFPSPSAHMNLNGWTDLSSAYLSSFVLQTGWEAYSSTSPAGFVIIRDFGSNNFTGPIPPLPVLGRMSRKHLDVNLGSSIDLVIDFRNNMISGEIPSDIGALYKSLKSLDVSNNMISGCIPQSLGDLDSLERLEMSGNKLQGHIPSSLGHLLSLKVLNLSSNCLTGEIPESLASLSNLTTLQLDNNQLSGCIPPALVDMVSLLNINVSWSTMVKNDDGSCQTGFSRRAVLLSGNQMDLQNYTSSSDEDDEDEAAAGSSRLNSIEIASIVSASAIVSVLVALIILFIYTRKWAPDSRVQVSVPREITLFTDIGVPLTFDKISNSTANFNASNCIGNGGFGATYRAEIAPGLVVAVKRLSVGRFHGVQQFHAEIKTLERVRHPNLVTLIGYHASETEMFLIYNYLPGGNLAKFIQERGEKATDWKILHKIALDIAQALAYLHDQCVPRVLHRDVKPSNILLDNDFNAYLSDFGLSRLLGTSETHATTGVAGTFGYLAPEYAMTCRVSDKADVYSYGIVLLELLSDKKTLDPSFSAHENGFTIVSWASMLLREGRAKDVFNPRLWETGPHKKLVDTLHLAVKCTVETLSVRPTMRQVAQQLKQLQHRGSESS